MQAQSTQSDSIIGADQDTLTRIFAMDFCRAMPSTQRYLHMPKACLVPFKSRAEKKVTNC